MANRLSKILEVLSEHQRMEVAALAELLDVSQVTIRKDLDQLEERGLIRREHGYASIELVDDVGKRLAFHYTLKKRIALAAAASVQEGETVMIESGSCCTLLAEELANNRRDVTIVTNSVYIANHVRYAPYGKIILLGGYYQRESQVLVGPLTRKCSEIFFSDKFFIGVDGFREKSGFTGNDHLRAQTVQDLAEQVQQILVLTDSDKFSRQGVVGLMQTSNIAAVYTDDKIPANIEAHLTAKNVLVHKVPSEKDKEF